MNRLNTFLLGSFLLLTPVIAACSDDDNGGEQTTASPEATQDATGATSSDSPTRVAAGATGDTGSNASGQSGQTGGGANNGAATLRDAGLPELIEEIRSSVVSVDVGQGEGSGVIWDTDGNIVTNNHVVAGATEVEIVLASGERLPGTVVATDPITDLAVVNVERGDLQPARFSDELPEVGSFAMAIGNPLGFESSVTLGIVSGLNRAIPSGGQNPALVDLLQTDAAISPGNSGGALINMEGEVIGINVAYIPPTQSAVSLGFAIPSPTAISVVEALLENGTVEHAFLGIEPRPLTPQIAQQLGLSVSEGVFVFGLTEGGAAATAGLETGDVIVGLDGEEITRIEDLYAILRDLVPGDSVPMTVVRDGDEMVLEVTLDSRPSPGGSTGSAP